MPVGIQGCADMFLGDDGLCAPSPDHCPAGTIPKFDEGCVAVGIAGCAPEFLEDDGQCYPLPEKCPAGTFPVPTEGCIPIDGPQGCGTGTWGNIAPAPGTVWVDPAYVGGGSDGSQQAPFTTIAAALAVASAGGRVALAAGNYAEPVTIDKPLELVGRCPSMVRVSGVAPTPLGVAAVVFVAQDVVLRGLRLGGQGVGVLAISSKVDLDGVHVFGATDTGVLAAGAGAMVSARHVLVEGTQPAAGGVFGRGIEAQSGAELALDSSALVENRDVGIILLDATAGVTRSLVAATLPEAQRLLGGFAMSVQAGSSLTLQSSALVHNRSAALVARPGASSIDVTESVIARTLPQASDLTNGAGVELQDGPSMNLARTAIVENHSAALAMRGAGTTAAVTETLIASTLPQESDLDFGLGLQVVRGASLVLESSAIVDNRDVGLLIMDLASAVVARSLVAMTRARESDGAYGTGIGCSTESHLDLMGSAVSDSATAAVDVSYMSTASIVGSLLERVKEGRFHAYQGPVIIATYEGVGDGLVAMGLSTVTVADTRIADGARAGVIFQESSGTLRSVAADRGRFGIVLQGALGPDWQDPSNLFSGGEQDVLLDGDLPVPEAPPVPGG